ncbi:transcription activator GLK1-like [Cornus florida]|uniref:transcription activator GLK1-like n=1 Tax=Cornus florida TaxID=4283 RepID=UPI00289D6D4A|nr:transcription activator GLK1-like [Cornus florida]
MLAVSPLDSKDETEKEMGCFSIAGDEIPNFSGESLLESIDFDDLFIDINEVLPDLEMDTEILAEFSVSSGEEWDMNTSASVEEVENNWRKEDVNMVWGSDDSSLNQLSEEDKASNKNESVAVNSMTKEADRQKKSSGQSKNAQGKRKVKVDWTPELHRRFVQAVEQLGVDKAVPSRILELMGIDCLTRHNIASHLQKYRSHRKHLLAREAEAANWSQGRQMYGATAGGSKRDTNPWVPVAPTMGFPQMTPPHHFRPLHVWGHPSVDQQLRHTWPKHLAPSLSPPPLPVWAPPPPLCRPKPEPPLWHSHPQHVPNSLTRGTPCFPPPIATMRFPCPTVPGILPHAHAMYRLDPAGIAVPTRKPIPSRPPFDFYPSKESIDAAIGDVLSKPCRPLPLGLKPPSTDSVLVELQGQGIPKIPPTTCA